MADEALRVKLSAEGQAELIAALRSIETAAQQTGRKIEQSFKASAFGKFQAGLANVSAVLGRLPGPAGQAAGAASALEGGMAGAANAAKALAGGAGGLTAVLLPLAAVIGGVVAALASFGAALVISKKAAQLADTLENTRQKFGATAEATAVLAGVMKQSGADIEGMGISVGKLAKAISDLRRGQAGEGAKALKELGLSAKDFAGKDLVQDMTLAGQAIAKIQDPADRGRLAVASLGRAGLQLVPTFNALAEDGLAPFIARVQRLFSTEAVAAVDRFGDTLERIGFEFSGLGIQFADAFAKPLRKAFLELEASIDEDMISAVRDLGTQIGGFGVEIVRAFTAGLRLAVQLERALHPILFIIGKLTEGVFFLARILTDTVAHGLKDVIDVAQFGAARVFGELFGIGPRLEKAMGENFKAIDIRLNAYFETWRLRLRELGELVAAFTTGAGINAAEIIARYEQLYADLRKRRDKQLAELKKPAAGLTVTPPPSETVEAVTDENEAALRARRKQRAQDELAATQARLAAEEQLLEAHYKQGLVTLDAFFTARGDIVDRQLGAEVKALRAQIANVDTGGLDTVTRALHEQEEAARDANEQVTFLNEALRGASPDEIQTLNASLTEAQARAKEAAKALVQVRADFEKVRGTEGVKAATEVEHLNAEIELKEQERTARRAKLDEERRVAALTAAREIQDLSLKGDASREAQHTREMARIAEEAAADRARLVQLGESPEVAAALAQESQKRAAAREDVRELAAEADTILADIDAREGAVRDRISAGLLSQLEGEQQVLKIEGDRAGRLQEIADLLRAQALALNDPALLAQAAALEAQVNRMNLSLERQTNVVGRLGATIKDAGVAQLADFLAEGVTEAESFTAAVLNMASAFIDAVRRMLAEVLAAQAIKALLGFFGEGGQVSGSAVARKADGGPVARFPGGGRVTGPGGSRDDRIPALLSHGEYVVRAARVRVPGMLEHLEHINRGAAMPQLRAVRTLALAGGGLVGGTAGAASGQPVRHETSLVVGLERGLVVREIETPEAERAIVRVVAKNRRSVSSALGT